MRAIRRAAAIVGFSEAEDVVHDVVEALLARRDFLRELPGGGFFVQCARNTALVRVNGGWRRWIVAMGLDEERSRLARPTSDKDDQAA
jgi:DNA-directed RNA polymerase specialized sigma24 family protein